VAKLGQLRYPDATRLVITADCGGSNRPRLKLRKRELQRFANETGLRMSVNYLPPGTSKWNKIEHRLFAFITQNWRDPELARQTVGQPSGHRPTHRRHHNRDRAQGLLRDRR
jgi:hypothetical protein